jgi:hypothetical protein
MDLLNRLMQALVSFLDGIIQGLLKLTTLQVG